MTRWRDPTFLTDHILAPAYFGLAAFCAATAIALAPGWLGTADGFLAGFNLASGIYMILLNRQRRTIKDMLAAMGAMHDLNGELLAGHVEVVAVLRGEAPPPPPTRH